MQYLKFKLLLLPSNKKLQISDFYILNNSKFQVKKYKL